MDLLCMVALHPQGTACADHSDDLPLRPGCLLWCAGPVLPHLTGCGAAVASIASVSPQLRSLSLSRYDVGSVASVTAASQLTSLALLHCSLRDGGLRGLPSLRHLQKLELSDNNLTWSCLGEVACLAQLVSIAACGGLVA